MKHLFNVLLLSLLLASPAVQASDTPESVARAYIAAINANGMEAGADFFHPDEQKRLKDMLQPVYDAIPEDDPAHGMGNVLRKMQADEFARRMMRLSEAQLDGARVVVDRLDILGSVAEGETVHLVARTNFTIGAVSFSKLQVISLKPYQDGWKLMLSGDIEGMVQGMQLRGMVPR